MYKTNYYNTQLHKIGSVLISMGMCISNYALVCMTKIITTLFEPSSSTYASKPLIL